ncbi:hypothetical protein MJT46_013372 [Ovis ammon polii x Ovis aries]|nr:hypothetical protein MJT46_013372 [Ovis ammon polii x Ovis aries]
MEYLLGSEYSPQSIAKDAFQLRKLIFQKLHSTRSIGPTWRYETEMTVQILTQVLPEKKAYQGMLPRRGVTSGCSVSIFWAPLCLYPCWDGRVHWTPVISCQLPSDVTSDMAGPKEDLLQPLGCGQDPPPALGPSSLMFPAAHDQSGCGKFKSFNSTTHWVPDLGLGFSGRKGTDIVRGPQDSVMASQVEVRSNMGPLSSSFFNDRVLQ